ncbi:MAG: DUF5689 domain-containing protein [Alistipes sp.]|nr:DUF5689 domain-containing protein [Alistipes sp.]
MYRWNSIYGLTAGALLLLCGCTPKADFQDDDASGKEPATQAISIAYLKSHYRNYPFTVEAEWSLRAVVTGNDAYGAFPYTLNLEDSTGGIELKLSEKELFTLFPVGQTVVVNLQGLVLGSYGGVLSLGSRSTEAEYENGFIPLSLWPQYLRKEGVPVDVRPDTLTFATLTPSKVSCYVAFCAVQFVEEERGASWCDPQQDTDRHLMDRYGDTLRVRTSHRADFASWTLPVSGSGYIEGILSSFAGVYQLRVQSPKGVVMESPRFEPRLKP